MGKPLDARQVMAIEVSERTMSVLSILGSLFIITTFLRWHYFRKPINRLVFYASFGNILTNVATLISTSALPSHAGSFTSLCEFQGILIQWFMMADALWVFCMALNVMLVFFYSFDSRQLRRLEKWYLLFSYGLPGITAFVYIILDHVGRQKIIGPAVIWCWVSSEVEWLRIAFFYGPIWVVVVATLMIYIVTGRQIFKKRAELRSFSRRAVDQEAGNTLTNPFTAADFRNIKVETEMKVETHITSEQGSEAVSPICGNESRSSFSSTKQLAVAPEPSAVAGPRFAQAHWESGSPPPAAIAVIRSEDGVRTGYKATAFSTNQPGNQARSISTSQRNPNRRRAAAMEGNAAAWGYFKVAFLMFAALFIVWVPSTANRLQQFINKEKSIFGLNLSSALVLPLQGFWNSMIYTSTTWPECKRAFAETLDTLSNGRRETRRSSYGKDSSHTLCSNETQEFSAPIALGPVPSTSESQRRLHSRMSSSETMRPASLQPEK